MKLAIVSVLAAAAALCAAAHTAAADTIAVGAGAKASSDDGAHLAGYVDADLRVPGHGLWLGARLAAGDATEASAGVTGRACDRWVCGTLGAVLGKRFGGDGAVLMGMRGGLELPIAGDVSAVVTLDVHRLLGADNPMAPTSGAELGLGLVWRR